MPFTWPHFLPLKEPGQGKSCTYLWSELHLYLNFFLFYYMIVIESSLGMPSIENSATSAHQNLLSGYLFPCEIHKDTVCPSGSREGLNIPQQLTLFYRQTVSSRASSLRLFSSFPHSQSTRERNMPLKGSFLSLTKYNA